MTFNKMQRVTSLLSESYGHVYATGGGELALEFTSQPEARIARQLKLLGFINLPNGDFIYRPIIRRKAA